MSLCPHFGGGTPSFLMGVFLPNLGCPHPSWLGVSHPSQWGYPYPSWWGYPHPRSGWGHPPFRSGSRSGWGTPPYPGQVPGQEGGITPYWNIIECTCYAVGGMPLTFTQEDLLVAGSFKSQLIDYFRGAITSWELVEGSLWQFYDNET